jgi:hypothetical protein
MGDLAHFVFDRFLCIAEARADFARELLDFALSFQFFTADDIARNLNSLAFNLFGAAFDLIFVHRLILENENGVTHALRGSVRHPLTIIS